MKVKKFLFICLSSIVFFGCFTIINAQSLTQAPTSLRLVTMDLPPYGWIDKDGNPRGIVYELTEEIGKRSGLPYTHKIRPFSRMLLELKLGKVDLLSSQSHARALDAGDRLAIQFHINVIAGTKKDSNIKTIKDFKDKNLLYHHGASYKKLDGLTKKIKYIKSYKQMLFLLNKRKEVDGGVFSEPAYYFWMKDLGLATSSFGNVVMIEENKEQWIFIRKDFPEDVRQILKKVVKEINKEGLYESLLKKYGKE